MKHKKVYLLILLLVTFVFTAAFVKSLKAKDIKSLLKKVNSNNSNKVNANIDMTKYMYSYNSNYLGISRSDLNYVTYATDFNKFPPFTNSKKLDKPCAISDVEFLFNLLKYSYAGYSYFGGEITFDNAKNNIINAINSMQKDTITSGELENILSTNLNFIQDHHFSINDKSMINAYYYYSDDNLRFTKSGNNYYTIENGTKLYIKSINDNSNFENYMKLSIDADGKLCYCIGQISNSIIPTETKLTLQSKHQKIIRYIWLNRSSTLIKRSDKNSYEYSTNNNIPVVTMRRMWDVDSNDNSTNLFAQSGKLLKNKPIFILDIRGNNGGQDIAAMTWFKNYIGEMPEVSGSSIELCSLINNYITMLAAKGIGINYETLPPELKKEYNKEISRAKENTNRWYVSKDEEKLHNNKAIIFVLIDNEVASSGESFISYLKTLKNVILVGTNTSGALFSGIFTQSQLPNSSINIKFGNTLTFIPQFQEGKGYQPDIWINSGDPIDRVLKLIKRIK